MTTTQPTPRPTETPTLRALGHVALTVRDLAVSVPWYQALIGSAPVLDEDTGPFRHVVFVLGETMFGLHQFPDAEPAIPHSPRRPGLDHVSFAVASREELAAWARQLDAMGIRHGNIVDAAYGSGLAVKDPDGLPLEVFCPPGT
jgi:catechol 2,3-dioxygenase-like lactoylglutathione lyase family enzyme